MTKKFGWQTFRILMNKTIKTPHRSVVFPCFPHNFHCDPFDASESKTSSMSCNNKLTIHVDPMNLEVKPMDIKRDYMSVFSMRSHKNNTKKPYCLSLSDIPINTLRNSCLHMTCPVATLDISLVIISAVAPELSMD